MTKPSPTTGDHKITICHSGNGKHFTSVETDYAGALGHAKTDSDDIIPAFPATETTEAFAGQGNLSLLETECRTTPTTTATTISDTPNTLSTTTKTATTNTTSITKPAAPVTELTTTTLAPLTDVSSAMPVPTLVPTTVETVGVSDPQPVRETLPVTGLNAPAMVIVASVLIAAGMKLIRSAQ